MDTQTVPVILSGDAPTFQPARVVGSLFVNGNSGTAVTIDWLANGNFQSVVRNGSATYTFTTPPAAGTFTLQMIHDNTANAYTVAFSPTPKYPGGIVPTFTNTANAVDIITFFYDGTNWYGAELSAFA